MSEDHFDVGVIVARRKLKGPWADHAWLPHAVLPAAPATAPWTSLGRDGEDELFYAGPFEVRLHPSETAHYRDNLASGRPSLWVSLRPVGGDDYEVSTVTADPYEGEALAGAIGETIEAVPMPAGDPGQGRGFLRGFPRRAALLQAQARPGRSGGARATPAGPRPRGGRMSGEFLSRWSRLKEEARRSERGPQPDAAEASAGAPPLEADPAPVLPEPELTPEELAALPKVEEITAASDISGFLRRGVPDALRNAALRKMWTLDPAIRDFVGEARDYAYDWNTPGGVPGSGALDPADDVAAMVRGVFGDSPPAAPPLRSGRLTES